MTISTKVKQRYICDVCLKSYVDKRGLTKHVCMPFGSIKRTGFTRCEFGHVVTPEQVTWLHENYPKYFKRRKYIAQYLGVDRYTANEILIQTGVAKEG